MEKNQIYSSIIENLPVGFSMVDREGKIIEFNEAAEKMTGYKKNEVIGRLHLEIFHDPADINSCYISEKVLKRKKKIINAETVIKIKNGERITSSTMSFPIYNEKGDFSGGVVFFRDITEQKKMERERKNFLSMFVHDMKNAIIPVQGFLKRMIEGKAGPLTEKQHEYLELIKEEMDKFELFVKDFLEFSKFEAKKYKPVYGDFHLDKALKRNIETITPEAEKKHMAIVHDISENIPAIAADGTMINRVLMNLLNNAVKYTKAGGRISVFCSMKNDGVLVLVRNPGSTISEKQKSYVFDAFYSPGKDKDGSGLGLAISKKIIDLHGGKIWVNVKQDIETEFGFTLPVRRQ